MKLPYYMIEFSASSCLFDIRVNDNPIITLNLKGQASTKMPINHAIHDNGEQEITVTILPLIGDTHLKSGAELYYNIKTYDVQNTFNLKEEIDGFKSKKIKDKLVPIIKNTKVFNANIPYALKTLWKDGEDIKKIEDYEVKIKSTYLSLGNTIKNKNFDHFLNMNKNRESNIKTSMYLSENESKARLNRVIKDLKNGFNHMYLPENAVPTISAYGKKISLRTPNGEPALTFINKEKKEQLQLDIEFYYNKEHNAFEII